MTLFPSIVQLKRILRTMMEMMMELSPGRNIPLTEALSLLSKDDEVFIDFYRKLLKKIKQFANAFNSLEGPSNCLVI